MTKNSKIEWCDHTFNTWWGCARISSGCRNCYADTLASRWGHELWRRHGPRKPMSSQYWKQPHRWNHDSPGRVFCGSMCDLFEAHPERKVREFQDSARSRLWEMIDATPNLTWLLLTKRPEEVTGMVPWGKQWPRTVWIGTSVEDQRAAETRIPHLEAIPAAVRFVSCEPLVSEVDLSAWLCSCGGHRWVDDLNWVRESWEAPGRLPRSGRIPCGFCNHAGWDVPDTERHPISWVICGGESGRKARPMHPDWARLLRDQCQKAGVPYFFKQWGEWMPVIPDTWQFRRETDRLVRIDGRMWPLSEPHGMSDGTEQTIRQVGKTASGRVLDGRSWDEFPRAVTT